jgi:uncharacterized membrane protein (DUF2068 family)
MSETSDQRILRAIAIFKLCKCAALLLLAAGAFEIARVGVFDRVIAWLHHLPLAEGHFAIHRAVSALFDLTPRNVELIGLLAVAYALLFGTEGYGLWRERHWAEYLTVVATASLVPFELWALIEKMTVLRFGALAINVAIVVWLVLMLRRKRNGYGEQVERSEA